MDYYEPPPPQSDYYHVIPQQSPPGRRYQIREKIFSFGDNFKIKNATGRPIFIVQSKLFTMGDNLMLEDMEGNPLMKIKQELMHLHPTYKIFCARENHELATVRQEYTCFQQKFCIDSIFGKYVMHGFDYAAHSFTLTKDDRLAASVDKEFFSWTDTYGVEIIGDENDAFIVALVIVIDQILYDNKQK